MTMLPVAGQVRRKTWRYLLPPTSDDDPVWRRRVDEYWHRFERLYGVVLHRDAIIMRIGFEDNTVSSWAMVARVLPGERVIGHTPEGVQPAGR